MVPMLAALFLGYVIGSWLAPYVEKAIGPRYVYPVFDAVIDVVQSLWGRH